MKIIYGNIADIKHTQDVEHVYIEQKKSTDDILLKYIDMFKNMDVKGFGDVFIPKKPIMLLSIMEMIEDGKNYKEGVLFDRFLENKFPVIWNKYVSADSVFKPDAKEAFKLLRNEPFCAQSNFIVIKFDDDLIKLLNKSESRNRLKEVLVEMLSGESKPARVVNEGSDLPLDIKASLIQQFSIFSNMRRASGHGHKAPHKPVLLVTFIILFEKGVITDNLIMLDNNVKNIFALVWEHYVKHKSFFSCSPNNPFKYMDDSIARVNESVTPHQMVLNSMLYRLMQIPVARQRMKEYLISMINV